MDQLDPLPLRRMRRLGLGDSASLNDFTALQQSDPLFANAWTNVNGQLQAEYGQVQQQYSPEALQAQAQGYAQAGYSSASAYLAQLQSQGQAIIQQQQARLVQAQLALTSAYSTMATTFQGGINPQTIANAAQNYVLIGKTIAGAVGTVESLVSTFDQGDPDKDFIAATNAFTGTMIGIAVAAGSVSAGTGAAIVGAIAAVLTLLQQAGILGGNPPQGTQVCGAYLNPPPTYVINCLGVLVADASTPSVAPGSPLWRTFPNPSKPADARWFVADLGPGNWKGAMFYGGFPPAAQSGGANIFGGTGTPQNPGANGQRPIDAAFPEYAYLECEMGFITGGAPISVFNPFLPVVSSIPPSFRKAFYQAWKMNRSYSLNGLKPQTDGNVLAQCLRLWNAAHSNSTTMLLSQQNIYLGTCDASMTPYVLSQVNSALAALTSDDQDLVSGTSLILHTGAALSPPKTSGLNSLSPPTASTAKTVALVAGGTVVAAAAGVGIYSFVTKQAFTEVLSQLWKRTVGRLF